MFSIILTTYNRHKMFEEALISLLNQTYKNFEIIVCDRGSTPSVETIIQKYNDPRVKYFQSSQDVDANDSGNEIVKMMRGDYFLFLADDDGLCPSALERVKKAFDEHQDCGIVQTAITPYFQNTKIQRIDKDIRNCLLYKDLSVDSSDDLLVFNGKDLASNFFSTFDIGDEVKPFIPSAFHASGFFIRMKNIREVFDKQGGLFVKPFGDVGYFAIAYNTNVCYLNLPLSIIGKNHIQETNNFYGANQKWKDFIANPKYAPLTIPSFSNITVEGTLKVIYDNNIDKAYKTYLRESFYVKHLEMLLSNPRISDNFWKDVLFLLKYVDKSNIKIDWAWSFKFVKDVCDNKYRGLKKKLRKYRLIPQKKIGDFGHVESPDDAYNEYLRYFPDINSFAQWIEEELITKREYIQSPVA